MTNTAALAHIETLMNHGAMIISDKGNIPLTTSFYFYENAVASCEAGMAEAITYDLLLPGIEEPMMIAIHKSGHVDTGSRETVMRVLDR